MKKQNAACPLIRRGWVKLAVIGLALCCTACSTEASLQRLLGTSASSVVFYGCKTPAEGEVHFLFSRDVKVRAVSFDPPMATEIAGEGATVAVRFSPAPVEQGSASVAAAGVARAGAAADIHVPGGSLVSANILVEDKNRNTLNVLVSFRTRNERMPDLVVNEIRAAYSKPRAEFIEFKILSAGNLGAMRLFAAYDKDEPIFEFPPVEVKKGDYVVVHTRSIEPGIADETGTNLAESGGTDALSTARDFWMPGALKLHSTNAVYVMDQDDRIIDGVLFGSDDYKWKDSVVLAARELEKQGMWSGSGPEHAVNANGATTTRTICRDESRVNSYSAADWYITVTRGATPGARNNPGRHK
jgi:hypothetical protein